MTTPFIGETAILEKKRLRPLDKKVLKIIEDFRALPHPSDSEIEAVCKKIHKLVRKGATIIPVLGEEYGLVANPENRTIPLFERAASQSLVVPFPRFAFKFELMNVKEALLRALSKHNGLGQAVSPFLNQVQMLNTLMVMANPPKEMKDVMSSGQPNVPQAGRTDNFRTSVISTPKYTYEGMKGQFGFFRTFHQMTVSEQADPLDSRKPWYLLANFLKAVVFELIADAITMSGKYKSLLEKKTPSGEDNPDYYALRTLEEFILTQINTILLDDSQFITLTLTNLGFPKEQIPQALAYFKEYNTVFNAASARLLEYDPESQKSQLRMFTDKGEFDPVATAGRTARAAAVQELMGVLTNPNLDPNNLSELFAKIDTQKRIKVLGEALQVYNSDDVPAMLAFVQENIYKPLSGYSEAEVTTLQNRFIAPTPKQAPKV